MNAKRAPRSARPKARGNNPPQFKAVGRTNGSPRRRLGWRARLVLAVVLAAVALVGWAVLARRLAPTANTERTRYDALIVLGTPADSDGNPTPSQLARVNEAVREYERGVAPRIVMTGGPAHNHFVEAEVMARTAEAEGIPASAVFVEGRAMDTIQNACYSVRLMKAHGWMSAEVVSTPSHLPRAAMILAGMPIEWRVHPAPPLTPDLVTRWKLDEGVEVLKTMRFLLWARLTERCEP